MEDIENQVLNFSFNCDQSCIIIGTTSGFGIYECHGFQLKYRADIGGVGLCEMLGKSNIVALVGAGENPEFPQKKLIIFDTKKNMTYCEFFYDNEKILNMKIHSFILAVITRKNLYIYNFPKVELVRVINIENPNGLLDVCNSKNPYLITTNNIIQDDTLNKYDYQVQLYDIAELKASINKENVPYQKISFTTEISFISLNHEGSMIAVAHTDGTLINIYKLPKLEYVITFYRGMSPAKIYSICFSKDSNFLISTSNRGTIHIFDIQSNNKSIKTSIMSFAKKFIGESSDKKETSILSKEHERKCMFKAAFSDYSKLIYVFDEMGYFSELRVMEDKKFSSSETSLRADDILKGQNIK